MATIKSADGGMSEDTKSIITVLLLIFLTPIGLILMWFWTKWQTWVKLVVTIPFVLWLLAVGMFVMFFIIGMLSAVNPSGAVNMAQCKTQCQNAADETACMRDCYGSKTVNPTVYPTVDPRIKVPTNRSR